MFDLFKNRIIYNFFNLVKKLTFFNRDNTKKKDYDFETATTATSNLLQDGIIEWQKIAKISVITLISMGIAEIVAGYFSGSNVATADGIDSLSDVFISLSF